VDGSVVRGHPDRRGTTWVDAPPAVVWPLVSDIGLMPTLSEELHAVEWLDRVTEPALGRRFVGRSKHATFGQWETTCTVVEYEPGVVFAWAVQDPDNPAATWRFRLEPDGRRTQLSQWAQMGPGPSCLRLRDEGFVAGDRMKFSMVLGVRGGMAATPHDLLTMVDRLPEGAIWQVVASARRTCP